MTEAPFTKQGERLIHEGYVISLSVGTFLSPDGEAMERDIVHHPGAVSVVPVDGDDVVLVRQFRAPCNRYLLELPAGKRDVDGEPPDVTARRELVEEIGMRATSLEPLAEFYNSVGFSDEYSFVFLARDLEPAEQALDGVEERYMSVERYPLTSVRKMIDAGEIIDGKTIIGLLRTLERLGVS